MQSQLSKWWRDAVHECLFYSLHTFNGLKLLPYVSAIDAISGYIGSVTVIDDIQQRERALHLIYGDYVSKSQSELFAG